MVKSIAFIDHFDSFSFNVIDWLGVRVDRIPADDLSAIERLVAKPTPIVLSPGPGSPHDAVASLGLCGALAGKIPILGICLGHQILGVSAGWSVRKSTIQFHGSRIQVTPVANSRSFAGIGEFYAATYNSLVIAPPDSSDSDSGWLRATALSHGGDVQAVESRHGPFTAGVQFHPESFLSEDLSAFRNRWLAAAFECL